jgi:S-adenosylmethionine/arginine decarboxylase-like enzyme
VRSLASAKEHIAEQLEAEAVEANRKRRGHITRELKAELQKVIADGHD